MLQIISIVLLVIFPNGDISNAVHTFRKSYVLKHDITNTHNQGLFLCSRMQSKLKKYYRIIADPEGVEQVLNMYY